MENDAATCQQIDTQLTRLNLDWFQRLKTLAAHYESADAYNKPAVEFVLRQQYCLYLSEPLR